MGSDQHPGYERPVKKARHPGPVSLDENAEVRPKSENMSKLREIVYSVMERTNSYEKARRVLVRILAAHKKSIPVGSESMTKALEMEPTVTLLNKARDLMLWSWPGR